MRVPGLMLLVAGTLISAGPGKAPETQKNLIDEFAFRRMSRDGVPHAPLSTDSEFLRRIYLDLTGRTPGVDVARKFLADSSPNKRDKLIDSVIAGDAFADRWTYWFGDLFRNSSTQIGRGQNAFHDYIRASLRLNVPYDRFVREMLTATALSNYLSGPSNLLVRLRVSDPKGGANAEDTMEEATIAAYRYFLGINLECVSCHSGAGHLDDINLWLSGVKREDFWRQAAMFGNMQMTSHKGYGVGIDDQGPGYRWDSQSVLRPKRWETDLTGAFLLTGEKPAPGESSRAAFARMLTSHPQFGRATVNQIWAELFGVGLVDPPFGFDPARLSSAQPPPAPWSLQPSDPDLLEGLAERFRKDYDLQALIKLIVNSQTYQLSSQFPGIWQQRYDKYPARRAVRRLTAEQLFDSISEVTGVYPQFQLAGSSSDNGQSPLAVKYVTQVRSPEDLGAVRQFLGGFGQSNRDQGIKVVKGNTAQALTLLNSPLIEKALQLEKGSRLSQLLEKEPPLSNQDIVDELFLAALSRSPLEDERKLGEEMLSRYRSKGAQDLLWVLLTKIEFLFY